MENWVRGELTGMKIAFFAIFATKDLNIAFRKQNINFQSMGKTKAIYYKL